MKKIILFVSVLFGMVSCSKEEPFLDISSGLEASIASVEAVGGTFEFDIATDEEWQIVTDGQDWYSFSQMSGTGAATVTVTVDRQYETKSRTANFSIETSSLTKTLTITQQGPSVPDDPTETTVSVRMLGGDKRVSVPEGYSYSVSIPDEAAEWLSVKEQNETDIVLTVARNTTADFRTAEVVVKASEGDELMTVTVSQSWRNAEPGEFLIEEIFFTGNVIESTGKVDSKNPNQYYKITNNTDEVLYADGLAIMESKINSVLTYTYPVDIRPTHTGVQTVYLIPGDGDDVPVEPHGSLLIANNAQNYLTANPNLGMDLSVADFEWYDESTNAVKDVDNPEVPNLDRWYTYSASFTYLHDRGFTGHAIAFFPPTLTVDEFLENYKWEGTYINHTAVGDFEMNISKAYKIPNSWVLDAVNLSVEEVFYTLSFDTSLDAGWTHCGSIDRDPNRYGKSVRRKADANGRLVDTNNSTADFTPDATPSVPIGSQN